MKLRRKLALHSLKLIGVFLLLCAGAALLLSLFVGGFRTTIFNQWIIWPGLPAGSEAWWLLAVALSGLTIFTVVAWNYSREMSAPLFYVLSWLEQLAQGSYRVPEVPERLRRPAGSFQLYKELTEKMTQLTGQLRQSDRERQELERLRREWTAGVTHDLKTPLSYIHGYTAMLLSPEYEWTQEERRRFLAIVQEKAAHMQQLIEDLNDAYSIEQRGIVLTRKRIDLVVFLQALLEDVWQQPAARGYELRFEPATSTLFYLCDEQLMRRALLNILMNGVLHNPVGTAITVSLRCEEMLSLRISDTGRGLSEAEQQHLFERYYRGVSTDTAVDGTGLGLAIAKQFIVAHGGTIAVQSVIGEGTTVLVSLPFIVASEPQ